MQNVEAQNRAPLRPPPPTHLCCPLLAVDSDIPYLFINLKLDSLILSVYLANNQKRHCYDERTEQAHGLTLVFSPSSISSSTYTDLRQLYYFRSIFWLCQGALFKIMQDSNDIPCLIVSHQRQIDILTGDSKSPINPTIPVLQKAESELLYEIPDQGLGVKRATDHVLGTITCALNRSSLSPSYYGFVTGGVTPAARVAENVATLYDQNVQVHLPGETLSTVVEDRALLLLLDLLRFDREAWPARTFTTGATSSNILGLACGREYVINQAVKRCKAGSSRPNDVLIETVGEHGLVAACKAAEVDTIQLLTTLPHSSLIKASSILGLGRSSVLDVSKKEDFLAFDLKKTEAMLERPRTLSIVVVSCGEVNTGTFATRSFKEVQSLRLLCDKYGAWIHVDGGKAKRCVLQSHRTCKAHSSCDSIWPLC